ncbi:MAG: hypothetical protein HY954_03055 [Deltaproteobacteria bacterium]|nr:hypothetical protein [Deltaproteobacteria bacterium]
MLVGIFAWVLFFYSISLFGDFLDLLEAGEITVSQGEYAFYTLKITFLGLPTALVLLLVSMILAIWGHRGDKKISILIYGIHAVLIIPLVFVVFYVF